jgi:hypothetical protein
VNWIASCSTLSAKGFLSIKWFQLSWKPVPRPAWSNPPAPEPPNVGRGQTHCCIDCFSRLAAQSRKARKSDDAEEIRNRRGHDITENTHCSSDRGQGVWTARVRHQRKVKYYVEGRTVVFLDRSPEFFNEAKKNKFTFFETRRAGRAATPAGVWRPYKMLRFQN